jgi:hypothetical protein
MASAGLAPLLTHCLLVRCLRRPRLSPFHPLPPRGRPPPPAPQELGLVGLRIQRMPTQSGAEFNNPAAYPYLSVASPSCHDVTPLRAW